MPKKIRTRRRRHPTISLWGHEWMSAWMNQWMTEARWLLFDFYCWTHFWRRVSFWRTSQSAGAHYGRLGVKHTIRWAFQKLSDVIYDPWNIARTLGPNKPIPSEKRGSQSLNAAGENLQVGPTLVVVSPHPSNYKFSLNCNSWACAAGHSNESGTWKLFRWRLGAAINQKLAK